MNLKNRLLKLESFTDTSLIVLIWNQFNLTTYKNKKYSQEDLYKKYPHFKNNDKIIQIGFILDE